MRIVLLNTSIITTEGTYHLSKISLEEVREFFDAAVKNPSNTLLSAIGHQATADILSDLLGTPIQANRIEYVQEIDDVALVFKLRARVPEGRILTRAEIEKIGYDFFELARIS